MIEVLWRRKAFTVHYRVWQSSEQPRWAKALSSIGFIAGCIRLHVAPIALRLIYWDAAPSKCCPYTCLRGVRDPVVVRQGGLVTNAGLSRSYVLKLTHASSQFLALLYSNICSLLRVILLYLQFISKPHADLQLAFFNPFIYESSIHPKFSQALLRCEVFALKSLAWVYEQRSRYSE